VGDLFQIGRLRITSIGMINSLAVMILDYGVDGFATVNKCEMGCRL
jgi:hypothetical protein